MEEYRYFMRKIRLFLEMSDEIIKKESSKSLINGVSKCLLFAIIIYLINQNQTNKKKYKYTVN